MTQTTTDAPRSWVRRHRRFALLSPVAALLPVLAGFAFFASSGTVNETLTIAAGGGAFSLVTAVQVDGGALQPGSAPDDFQVTIKNNQVSGNQYFATLTGALKQDVAGGVWDQASGTYKDGCLASWFVINGTITGTLPIAVAPNGGTFSNDNISVSMPANNSVNQNECVSLNPILIITAN